MKSSSPSMAGFKKPCDEQIDGGVDGPLTDRVSQSAEMECLDATPMRRVCADDDCSDRLFGRSAARAGDAADGHAGLHVKPQLEAVQHLVNGRFADGAMPLKRLFTDT